MAGQSRAVASVGVAMQVASLQELAYSMGIKKSVKEMTQAEKTYLRYIQLMNSTKQMQGDLGRTMITPANAIRTLRNQLNLLSRAIGQVLTPIIMEAIPYIMAFTNVLTRAASALANFFGYKIADVDYSSAISFEDAIEGADNLGKLGSAASKAGKQVSESLAPFDELNNVISENDTAGSGYGSGVGGGSIDSSIFDTSLPQYDMLKDYTDDLVKKAGDLEGKATVIAAILGAIVGGALLGKLVIDIVKVVEAAGKIWKVVSAIGGKLLGPIVEKIGEMASKLTGPIGKGIATFAEKLGLSLPTAEGLKAVFATIGQVIGGVTLGVTSLSLALSAVDKAAEDNWFISMLKVGGSIGTGMAAGAVIGGPIGAAIGGLASMGVIIGATIQKFRTLNEVSSLGLAQFRNDTAYAAKAIEEFNYKYGETLSLTYQNAEAKLKEVSHYETLRDRLEKITDSQGNIIAGHRNEAKAIAEELNTALGTNIKIRGNQIEGYKKLKGEIDNYLKQLKAEVKLEAMREAWKTAVLEQAKATDALKDAEANLKTAQEKVNKSMELYGYVVKDAQDEYDKWKGLYDETAKHYQESTYNIQRYEDAMTAYTKKKYDEVNDIYDNSSKNQYNAFRDSLVKMTNELKGGELTEELLDQWKTLGYTDANAFNEELLKIGDAKTRYQILLALDNWNAPLKSIGETGGDSYAGGVTSSAQKYFNNNIINPKIGLTPNTPQSLYNDINKPFKNNTITATISSGNSGKTMQKEIKTYFNNNPMSLQWTSEKSTNGNVCVLKAGGGYVDSGDLFFANENGVPEYITSVGNKSAVVNQAQMIQTLTNAITAGFQQFGGAGASNVTVYVGDKKLYEGQGEYQTRQNDRYGTTVVRI